MRIMAIAAEEQCPGLEQAIASAEADLAIVLCKSAAGDQAAQLSDGPLAHFMAAIAARTGCALLIPYLERERQQLFSSVLFVDRDGRGLCSYRQTHLDRAEPNQALSRGNWLTIVPFGHERIGLLLGEDLLHPEPARCLALEGATLLIAVGSIEASLVTALAQVRALENAVAAIVVTSRMQGRMVACDRSGGVLTDMSIPTEIPTGFELDGSGLDPPQRLIDRRRPELYRAMAEPPPA